MPNLSTSFQSLFHTSPSFTARAPGRVNLLGEHIDYNAGPVLPAAIDRAVNIVARPTEDGIVTLHALDLGKTISFRLADLDQKIDVNGRSLPTWAYYPAGVAWVIQSSRRPIHGLQAVYTSNVPMGAGLSSSAAVEVAYAVLWQAIDGWPADRMAIAQMCQRAENRYVGVSCGLMDQFASAHGVENHALYFDTRSLEWQPAPLPDGVALVVADCNVPRSLVTSEYNERRAACEKAVELLKGYLPEITSLRDVATTEFAAYAPYLPDNIRKRAEHVVKEIARVQSALTALQRADMQAFGALMYAGHNSLRDLYEVSTPELDALVEIARQQPGVIGARLTGAGFGGCTINLVWQEHADTFIKNLSDGYTQMTGRKANVYLCKASQGALARPI